ncbi:MAG TPA: PepSY domain-containing protein [Gammaproteobacteria bacterium]|nr:PepSY domain-containing protein [Gammaproteobacteria bacterium]
MKRLIILLHRYVGIPMSVVFVVWLVSGIVMIYTGGMPALGADDRHRGQGPIDFEAIEVSPAEAAASAGINGAVTGLSLGSLLGRPAWRIGRGFGSTTTVFADTGEVFDGADSDEAVAESARFIGQPGAALELAGVLTERDQWTIALSRSLPLDRYDVDDGRGTRVYFSRDSGQVELVTDRTNRVLAWAGAIPHWFYFSSLRLNDPVWYWTVVWVSVIGCGMAVLGLILAFTQFRRSKPFRLSASIRYRGSMRWHYYTGALFGVFALTWAFSGLMSMEPFDWTTATGMRLPVNSLQGGALALERYDLDEPGLVDAFGDSPAEVELMRIQGEPYYRVASSTGESATRRLVDAATLEPRKTPFPAESILAELRRTVTDAGIVEHTVLDEYDTYYYARGGAAPLPVLRVKFDDPAETWYYFDLMTSGTVASNHRLGRIERWLFNGLHSLDFSFWYDRRPLWDAGMILLSLGALATSGIGMYLGFRRLTRQSNS